MAIGFRICRMEQSWEARVLAVAALEEPTRRRVYEHVVRRPAPVTRDDVARALGLPRTTAAFHLDRLADEGLLDVAYERRTGRSGPGAGRPSKLYSRTHRHIAVSLPERRYDVAGHLLAAALDDAAKSGQSPRAALDRHARQLGAELGESARAAGGESGEESVVRTLEQQGFEPRTEGADIVLGNCPFHTLARQHTELVCNMNLCLVDGLLAGIGDTGLHARLDPGADRCCVRLTPVDERPSHMTKRRRQPS
jgi:predicted ArsR family transcriptional regulator